MSHTNNGFISILFAVLIANTAYTFLWSRFGFDVTSIVQYALLGFVILGIWVYLVTPSSRKNAWMNWLILLWITQLLAFYLGHSSATTQFKEATFVLLVGAPIISLEYNPKIAKWSIITMALMSIAMFFVTVSMMRVDDENSYGGGYLIIVALPVFWYFLRRSSLIVQVIITLVLFIIALSSMKRGDILACILATSAFFYINYKSKRKNHFRFFVAIAITALVGFFAFKYFLTTNDIFASRFEQTLEGDTSNRDIIYSLLWSHYLKAPLGVKLFGGGFDATLTIGNVRAHSDLLEVLSCEGLVGLIIYLCAFFSLFGQVRKRTDVTEKAVLASVLVIWLVKMIFSMFIFSQPSIILFVLTAYILNNRK